MHGGLRWIVGNGHKIRFWWYIWVAETPLYSLSIAPIPEDIVEGCIADFVTPEDLGVGISLATLSLIIFC